MAIGIENQDNIIAPDATYPNGDIKDRSGSTPGTPVNRKVYADIHQFFAKLLRLATITANDTPDNEINGFQYIDALEDFVRPARVWSTVAALAPTPFQNGWSSFSPGTIDPNPVQFSIDKTGRVDIRGAATGGINNTTIFTLPLLLRPAKDVFIPRHAFESSAWVPGGVLITKTGTVSFSGAANDVVYLDGIYFFID